MKTKMSIVLQEELLDALFNAFVLVLVERVPELYFLSWYLLAIACMLRIEKRVRE